MLVSECINPDTYQLWSDKCMLIRIYSARLLGMVGIQKFQGIVLLVACAFNPSQEWGTATYGARALRAWSMSDSSESGAPERHLVLGIFFS